jgi:hypothetical protein
VMTEQERQQHMHNSSRRSTIPAIAAAVPHESMQQQINHALICPMRRAKCLACVLPLLSHIPYCC